MKILIGCERSGIVREAFRALGHDAWSCDLVPATDGSPYHLQMDVMCAVKRGWDGIILHPTCTAVTVAGNHKYAKGKSHYHERVEQARWIEELWYLARDHAEWVVLENPKGVLPTMTTLGKAQYIQPHQFGHDASKETGLWLHNVPKLKPTESVPPRYVCDCGTTYKGLLCTSCKGTYKARPRWANQLDSGQNRLGPSPTRAMERATTYQGIADAFAAQWGGAR